MYLDNKNGQTAKSSYSVLLSTEQGMGHRGGMQQLLCHKRKPLDSTLCVVC